MWIMLWLRTCGLPSARREGGWKGFQHLLRRSAQAERRYRLLAKLVGCRSLPIYGPPRNGDYWLIPKGQCGGENVALRIQNVSFEDGLKRTVSWYREMLTIPIAAGNTTQAS